jgi:hypothetical protein
MLLLCRIKVLAPYLATDTESAFYNFSNSLAKKELMKSLT